jgi:hypothetical protein
MLSKQFDAVRSKKKKIKKIVRARIRACGGYKRGKKTKKMGREGRYETRNACKALVSKL